MSIEINNSFDKIGVNMLELVKLNLRLENNITDYDLELNMLIDSATDYINGSLENNVDINNSKYQMLVVLYVKTFFGKETQDDIVLPELFFITLKQMQVIENVE